jgi:dTDP-4-amino-4,6-dideoxygalactose transaminase
MRAPRLGVWPSLSPAVYIRPPAHRSPFPLGRDGCSIYAKARHALYDGCLALDLRPGDEVLAPAYHHGSEIEALSRVGLRVRFFDGTDLEPDQAELEDLLAPSVRGLYLIHYLGFPQDARRWRTWCDERGLLLFEDAAQAWLADRDGLPVGSLGDLAIFCLYKTIGLPDGAALLASAPASRRQWQPRTGAYGALKRHGAWISQRSAAAAQLFGTLSDLDTRFRSRGRSPEETEFALGDPREPPSTLTRWLLPRMVDPAIAEKRRRNYRFLFDRLGRVSPQPFSSLPDGASPFAFPIEREDAREFVERLEARGVKAILLWRFPHPSLRVQEFPAARRLRDTVAALPVHQDLSSSELQRIVSAVEDIPP